MRQIIISGCGNCPYLTIWSGGEGEGEICTGTCSHPSFNKQLGQPRFASSTFYRERNIGEDFKSLIPDEAPKWCPLPKIED